MCVCVCVSPKILNFWYSSSHQCEAMNTGSIVGMICKKNGYVYVCMCVCAFAYVWLHEYIRMKACKWWYFLMMSCIVFPY